VTTVGGSWSVKKSRERYFENAASQGIYFAARPRALSSVGKSFSRTAGLFQRAPLIIVARILFHGILVSREQIPTRPRTPLLGLPA